jgi:hypothetical protein
MSAIPPLIPRRTSSGTPNPGPDPAARKPLPLAPVPEPDDGPAPTAYVMSVIDHSGLADRSIPRALGWMPGLRLDMRVPDRVIIARPATDGVCRVDSHGFVIIPLAVRRWCRLTPGTRLLFAADPAADVLRAFPADVLDALLRPAAGGGRDD